MPERIRPTEEDGKRSLVDHAADKAWEARQTFAPGSPPGELPVEALRAMLEDRRFVRYPVKLAFDAGPLQSGEFAIALPGEDGKGAGEYVVTVHPVFENDLATLPKLVAYHLVCVNYGEIASHEAAEAFGAALMGMDIDDYYNQLCQVADALTNT